MDKEAPKGPKVWTYKVSQKIKKCRGGGIRAILKDTPINAAFFAGGREALVHKKVFIFLKKTFKKEHKIWITYIFKMVCMVYCLKKSILLIFWYRKNVYRSNIFFTVCHILSLRNKIKQIN